MRLSKKTSVFGGKPAKKTMSVIAALALALSMSNITAYATDDVESSEADANNEVVITDDKANDPDERTSDSNEQQDTVEGVAGTQESDSDGKADGQEVAGTVDGSVSDANAQTVVTSIKRAVSAAISNVGISTFNDSKIVEVEESKAQLSCEEHVKNEHEVNKGQDKYVTPIHGEISATCTDNGYVCKGTDARQCALCKKIFVFKGCKNSSALGHDWDEGTVTEEATCTAAGKMTYTCARCSETKDEETDVLGHNSEGSVEHKDATCTEDGVVGGTYCTRCDDGREAAEKVIDIDPEAHDWGEEVVEEATVDRPETHTRICNHNSDHVDVFTVGERLPGPPAPPSPTPQPTPEPEPAPTPEPEPAPAPEPEPTPEPTPETVDDPTPVAPAAPVAGPAAGPIAAAVAAVAPLAAAPAATPVAAPADAPEVTIEDDLNPLAAAPEAEIADDENPLGAFDQPQCWTHLLMYFGIIITLIYGFCAVARRLGYKNEIDKMDKNITRSQRRARKAAHSKSQVQGA